MAKPIKYDVSYYLAMEPGSDVYVIRMLTEDYFGAEIADVVHSTYHKHDLAKRTVVELNLREREND